MIKVDKVSLFNGKNIRILRNDGKIIKGYLIYDNIDQNCKVNNFIIPVSEIEKINEIPKEELDTSLIIEKNKDKIEKTFEEANSFMRLIDQREYDGDSLLSEIPLAVNCIFACELYLKVLLLNRGFTVPDIKLLKHNLKKLYINLNDNDVLKINEWINIFCQYDLLIYLDEIKNSFEDLRYNFIEEKVSKIDMSKLLEFTFKIQNYSSMEIVGYDVYRFPNGRPTKEEEDNYLDNFVYKYFASK